MTAESTEKDRPETHDVWCDKNGCRCGKCPCAEFPDCYVPPAIPPAEETR